MVDSNAFVASQPGKTSMGYQKKPIFFPSFTPKHVLNYRVVVFLVLSVVLFKKQSLYFVTQAKSRAQGFASLIMSNI